MRQRGSRLRVHLLDRDQSKAGAGGLLLALLRVGLRVGLVGLRFGLVRLRLGLVGFRLGLVGFLLGLVGLGFGLVSLCFGLVGFHFGLVGFLFGFVRGLLGLLRVLRGVLRVLARFVALVDFLFARLAVVLVLRLHRCRLGGRRRRRLLDRCRCRL